MRGIFRKKQAAKRIIGKVVTGVLLGSIVGATVDWLTAPASGEELRRRIKEVGNGSRRSVREKVKTA